MRSSPVRSAVLSALAAATLLGGAALPAAANPTPSPTRPAAPHLVPPPAPAPTDHGNSPAAPDPHPPRGGIGPLGEAVGGARLLSRGLVLPAGAPAPPKDLSARAWVVVDLDDGAVLAARDAHGRYQPASIQKLLTALTLLPILPAGELVRVSRQAANTEGSHAGLVGGGLYTVADLFRGLLLVSGNDAAEALADLAGGRAHTVALMNATARELGAYDTLVQTPSGLDGWRQLTSAYDMALILRAALALPSFAAYDTTPEATLPRQKSVGRVAMYNQNIQFLTSVRGALVAKTGYTDAAQHTFVCAIRRDGHRYGVVLLRAQRYPDDQWVQATKLVTWAARLPAGTPPVGQLAPAVQTAARVTATGGLTSPASAAAASGSASPPPSGSSPPNGSSSPSSSSPSPQPSGSSAPGATPNGKRGVALIILVLFAVGIVLLAGRLRRGTR
ncbi:serine hydrolase [uncultured Jatrophihabitans sp.]|uniref:D-alanyl-D-alanine carboxypeptidase family protein n=1 Tax=uncultured Jatrophihabitans sp. TaxID=1610747 RepID=UPI0035CB9EDD